MVGELAPDCVAGVVRELIAAREQQHLQRLLVGRVDGKDVETDALGRPRFIQQAVVLGALQRARNRPGRESLELEVHSFFPRTSLTSAFTGS